MAGHTVVAYLKPTCGWSKGVRAILQKYGLPYEDRDVINNSDNFTEMIQKSGQTKQPCVEIDGEILADISGDELDAWLVGQGFEPVRSAPEGILTNGGCWQRVCKNRAKEQWW